MLNKKLLEENITKAAQVDFDEHFVFGCAYAVCQNGELLLKKYFGTTKLGGDEAVSDNTMFRLASMTKPITGVAIMILVDRGLIALDDKVSKYIPEFADVHIIDDDGNDLGKPKCEVTIRHLLAHTSGFGSRTKTKITKEDRMTIEDTINFYLKEGLEFEPTSVEHYSAYAAFDVLTVIAEKVTGAPFDKFLQDEIFDPCGMTDITFNPTEEQWSRFIQLHNKVDDKCVVGDTTDGCVFIDMPTTRIISGAGLAATLPDYIKFAEMLTNGGKVGDKQIVSEEALKLMATPQLSKDAYPGDCNWGLTVRVIETDTYEWLVPKGSFGWAGYYGTFFWVDPVNKISAIFLKNSLINNNSHNDSAKRFELAVMDSFE